MFPAGKTPVGACLIACRKTTSHEQQGEDDSVRLRAQLLGGSGRQWRTMLVRASGCGHACADQPRAAHAFDRAGSDTDQQSNDRARGIRFRLGGVLAREHRQGELRGGAIDAPVLTS
jgi:hypothetical protein